MKDEDVCIKASVNSKIIVGVAIEYATILLFIDFRWYDIIKELEIIYRRFNKFFYYYFF
jgi:hypothetical protein